MKIMHAKAFKRVRTWALVLALLSISLIARADEIGTSVSGSLYFQNQPTTNYFDPNHGFVPVGAGNSAGTTVTIGSNVEFEFTSGNPLSGFIYSIAADFGQTGVTFSLLSNMDANLVPFQAYFTDASFTGFNQTSGSGNGLYFSFSGDTLEIYTIGNYLTGQDLPLSAGVPVTSTFAYSDSSAAPVAATPEPSSIALLVTGLLVSQGSCTNAYI